MIRAMVPAYVAATARRFLGIEAFGRITDWPAVVFQKQALVHGLKAAKYTGVLPNYPGLGTVPIMTATRSWNWMRFQLR
ncbi:hypothetical protein [Allgaiera indica]|nr:hypothetical protein [Allgaiera indica]